MLNSWFGGKSSRHRKSPSNPRSVFNNAQPGLSDVSSVTQPVVGPSRTPRNSTPTPDVSLDEVHVHTNDPSVCAPTPSLIHSTEKEAGTLRTSNAPASLDAATQRVSMPELPEGALFTPQDDIIAQVFGKFAQPTDSVQATPSLPSSNAPQPSASLVPSDSVPQTPPSVQASRVRTGPILTIYDPFSGARLGERTPMSPSMATPHELSVPAPLPTADDRKLWSSLERILELQAEIAAMHADMEGVGRNPGSSAHTGGIAGVGGGEGRSAGSKRRLRRGQTLPIGDEELEDHEPEGAAMGGAASEISTDRSDGDDDDDYDDDDDDGVHGYGKKRRDEEFARLTEQFAQRKIVIGGIMDKLDALSTALKTFHTLPPPLFDLAVSPSRSGTVSSAPSNISVASLPHPLHLHPGSSVSPHPVTLPTTPRGPPVPPVSTLAPPLSSEDPRALPGLAPIVAPVLPQTALPTIIPGAPHVESPADMNHPQSIFQGEL